MKRLTAFTLTLTLAACANHTPPRHMLDAVQPTAPIAECKPAEPAPVPVSPMLAWQAFQHSLITMNRASQNERLAAAEKAYAEKPTGEAVMRLALSLQASGTAPRQERAQRLFNNLRIDPRLQYEEQQFAAVQAQHLNELRLVRQERVKLEQRLAHEQAAKAALDEKIKALTTIELKINERQRSEMPPAAPQPPADSTPKPVPDAGTTPKVEPTPESKPKPVPPKASQPAQPEPEGKPAIPAPATEPSQPAAAPAKTGPESEPAKTEPSKPEPQPETRPDTPAH